MSKSQSFNLANHLNQPDFKRCKWCNLQNPRYITYHDQEWGRLNLDDQHLYELLILESFQAGLSWECILNKRENFRQAYDGFNWKRVAQYDHQKIAELLADRGIIRNRRKIIASIKNSQIFCDIIKQFGSFRDYLESFTGGQIIYETGKTTNSLSNRISQDLSSRGMSFVGSTIIYAYLQAIGIIYSHDPDCQLYLKGDSNNS